MRDLSSEVQDAWRVDPTEPWEHKRTPEQALEETCVKVKKRHKVQLDWRALDHGFHLDLLLVPYLLRGRGIGEAALSALCAGADKSAVGIHLDAAGCMGADLVRLVGWYERHGFLQESDRTPEDPRCVAMARTHR